MKKKIFYLLVVLLVFSLAITGCSSGGGDNNDLPGTEDQDNVDSLSVSGEIIPPSFEVKASSNGNSNLEFTVYVKDFDSGEEITTLDVNLNSEGNYRYTLTDGVKEGRNLLITAISNEESSLELSGYIPNIGNNAYENAADLDPDSTMVAKLIEVVKESNQKEGINKTSVTPEEVMDLKQKIKEKYGSELWNENNFREKIENIKKNNDDFISENSNLIEEIEKESKANIGSVGSAKEMISFVRNSGVFLEKSAAVHEKTIPNNIETVSKELSKFTADFEKELEPLFISNFANRIPTNAQGGKVYNIDKLDVDDNSSVSDNVFNLAVWEWEITDGANTIFISTDIHNALEISDETGEIESIDFSAVEFDYEINTPSDDYYFDGSIDMNSSRTEAKEIRDNEGNLITLKIPEKATGIIKGEIKTTSLETPANIDINISQDSQFSSKEISGDVSWTGSFEIPNVINYNGTLSYQGKAMSTDYLPDYFEYYDIQFNGKIETPNGNEDNRGLKIVADNLEINTERVDSQLELTNVKLKGYFVDKPETSKWSGDLIANFDGQLQKAQVTDFSFTGEVEHVDYADLKIDLSPELTYNDGELSRIKSNIKVERGSSYLEGIVDASPEYLEVNLKNHDENEFNLVENGGDINAAKSNIKNKSGEIIADIDEDGIIYYETEDGSSGEIGSLY